MDDMVKVPLAAVEVRGGATVLAMKTIEGIQVEFELDDVALRLLGLTTALALDAANRRESRIFHT